MKGGTTFMATDRSGLVDKAACVRCFPKRDAQQKTIRDKQSQNEELKKQMKKCSSKKPMCYL